jgi:lysophospholipase L1-like esterase
MNKKENQRGFARILLIIIILVAGYFLFLPKTNTPIESILPAPTPYQFPYRNPVISKNDSYRMVIVGDSIVGSLGPNANTLREDLISYYPDSEFVTYNYGYASSNVLTLYERLTEKTVDGAKENKPVLELDVELIIIESFGYNPLSEYTLEEGLKKQNEELEKSVAAILSQKPNASLAFLTPIALDPINFARSSRNLSPEIRKRWVEERTAYINNHKKFAQEKGIPVIDVYQASLKQDGTVDKIYISDDFVHPSKAGIQLISKTIADYIWDNKIFPQ